MTTKNKNTNKKTPLYIRPKLSYIVNDIWGTSLADNQWESMKELLPETYHENDNGYLRKIFAGTSSSVTATGEQGYVSSTIVSNLKKGLMNPTLIVKDTNMTYIELMLKKILHQVKSRSPKLSLDSCLWHDYLDNQIEYAKDTGLGDSFVRFAEKAKKVVQASKDSGYPDDCIAYAFFLIELTAIYQNLHLDMLAEMFCDDDIYINRIIDVGIENTFIGNGDYSDIYEAVRHTYIARLQELYTLEELLNINKEEEDNEFDAVYEIVSQSSTTQSLDVFLRIVIKYLTDGVADIQVFFNKYDAVIKKVVEFNSEYRLLGDTWTRIKEKTKKGTINKAINIVKIVYEEQVQIRRKIRAQAEDNFEDFINATDTEMNILLPSVSSEAAWYLTGLPPDALSRIRLFIQEARPKVPTNVNSTLVELRNGMDVFSPQSPFLSITVIPDFVAMNLLSRGKIDLIIYGSSRILMSNKTPYWMTNSCGTESILLMAEKRSVKVHVVARKDKYEEVETDECNNLSYTMYYNEESGSFDTNVQNSEWKFEKKNIRRDFCKLHKGILLVNEDNSFTVDEDEHPLILVKNSQDSTEFVMK